MACARKAVVTREEREELKMTDLELFQKHSQELSGTLSVAIEKACSELDFDLQCLDWFSYNPDFHIEKKNLKAA